MKSVPLKVPVRKKPAIAVGFQPVVQMNLVEIGGDEFLSQFMGLTTKERYLKAREHGDQ